jgi:outer membrane protein OmpA-like peptidoglycan-associated protein
VAPWDSARAEACLARPATGDSFAAHLARGYQEAAREALALNRWADAAYLAGRACLALDTPIPPAPEPLPEGLRPLRGIGEPELEDEVLADLRKWRDWSPQCGEAQARWDIAVLRRQDGDRAEAKTARDRAVEAVGWQCPGLVDPFVLYFASDSAELPDLAAKVLPYIVDHVRRLPRVEIALWGSTDVTGPKDYNDRLALRRAEAVRDALVAMIREAGLPVPPITVASAGEQRWGPYSLATFRSVTIDVQPPDPD